MSNIIKQKFKHGVFSYYSNDQYIGKSLSEYGEWSEAEVSLLKQLLANNENIYDAHCKANKLFSSMTLKALNLLREILLKIK